jgi:hypothetical protein
MSEKPHFGRIDQWQIVSYFGGKKLILGKFLDHPRLAGRSGHTSDIIKRNGNEVETRNSRYTLLNPDKLD